MLNSLAFAFRIRMTNLNFGEYFYPVAWHIPKQKDIIFDVRREIVLDQETGAS